MDLTAFRLLFRLSLAVFTLVYLVVATAVGIELPFGRANRGVTVFGLLGSAVAILLLTARLARRRQPDSRLAGLAPEVLFRAGLAGARGLAGSTRARSSVAVHRRRRAARVRQVELAALEAAKDDDRLAPESIRESAEALFRLVYLAWDARDPARLATLVAPEPMLEWERVLEANERAGGHHRTEVLDGVQIDLIGLTRTAEGGDTAIVLIEAELSIQSGQAPSSTVHRLCQYWTLVMCDGLWTVHATEERAPGDRHLDEPIVAQLPSGG